eukprot:1492824-Alexandrium_andersonii.AAC.1
MSASLVGSEMCIRDSPSSSVERRASCGPPSGRRCGVGPRQTRDAPGSDCLLYTSDAADDM